MDEILGTHRASLFPIWAMPGALGVRACAQAAKLVAWAACWPERTWAVTSTGGLGHLLAQQLVAAGEWVLGVPAKLAAGVLLLEAGDTSKNDPNGLPVAASPLPTFPRVWWLSSRRVRSRVVICCDSGAGDAAALPAFVVAR